MTRGFTVQQIGIGALVLAAVATAITALLTMDTTGERSPRTGARYVEQALASAPVDPARIGWQESATWPTAVTAPRGLAAFGVDRIVVVGHGLEVLAADGRSLLHLADVDYRAVAFDRTGRAFVTASTRVDVLDVGGNAAKTLGSVDLAAQKVDLTAIAVGAQGLFVADARGCIVWRIPLAKDGMLDAKAEPEVFAARFTVPSTMDLTLAPDGELVTVDPGKHTVQRRDGYGDVVRAFGAHGDALAEFPGCCNPIAIAMLPDGRTVTAEKGLATTRVKVYDGKGQLQSVVAARDQFDVLPDGPPIVLDVAVDAGGRVLVLDPHRRQVRVFTAKEQGK